MASAQSVSINPATGERLGTYAIHTPEDVAKAVHQARSVQQGWMALGPRQRTRHLKKVRHYITENADSLAEIVARDNGKTRTDAMATEVLPAALAVDYYSRKGRALLKDKRLLPATMLFAYISAKVVRVPYGVVGIISPWNYPFGIPFSEVIMALMAGNAVILKVASQVQLVGHAIKDCMAAADLPPGLFSLLNLPGHIAGPAFLDAGVDKLFFTGSVAAGKTLMAKAAETLTPLVLELGGNDPMLVCPDADIERAAAGAVWAGMQNCGQSCGGVERIYVHRSIYDRFLDQLAMRVRQLRVGYDTDYDVDMGAMTTDKQLKVVRQQVAEALEAGAKVHTQSKAPSDSRGNFLPAMVLTNVDHHMRIMREETFGPVVAVMAVEDMDQAVSLANDCDLGLTASVWTNNRRTGERLGRRIQAGAVLVNDHLTSHGLAETPWGGFKQSGIGRTHGAIGMAEMTQVQCLVQDFLPGLKHNLWWYPHGPSVYRGMRGIIEFLYGGRLWLRLYGLSRIIAILPRIFKRNRFPQA